MLSTRSTTQSQLLRSIICEDENRPYPCKMLDHGKRKSLMCCDSILEQSNITINFLDDTKCVPFRNEMYMPFAGWNSYGKIAPIMCNNKGIYSELQFPRIIKKTINYSSGNYNHYNCCKTGDKTPPFIQDLTFKMMIYPQSAVSAIAVLSLLLLITAFLIPL